MNEPDLVYLSLGSNLGDRRRLLIRAIQLLSRSPLSLVTMAPFIETEPWGFRSSHPFLNTIVAVRCALSPSELLRHTQKIEKDLGRTSKSIASEYHDRPIDIDIILYKGKVVLQEDLTIPHPLMAMRKFVLEPLSIIAPEITHPILQETIRHLNQKLLQ